jgi:hypothetical protein
MVYSLCEWMIRTRVMYTIVKAYKMSERTGLDVFDGWDIYCGDNWCQRYWTRRECVSALLAEGITL